MAGVVYYTGAQREFLGVCAREETSERRRRSKLVSCSPSFLNFQGAFSVNKYEGKCSFSFFFYSISGVRSARYNLYGKKGKTVTPSRKLQFKQRAIRLLFRRSNNAINILVLVHVQNYKRARSLVRSSPHYITFLDIRLWNNKNFPLCVIYLLISLLFFFLRYYSTCLHCVKNMLWLG